MNNTAKKLLLQAEDGYRNSDTEYALYVHHKGTPAACNALHKRLEASGLEYKQVDYGAYLYVDLDEVAQYGLTEEDLNQVTDDLRASNKRLEQEREAREQKQREKEARLLGQYEAMLAVHIEDPRQRVVLGLRLVEAAKEVL